MPITGCWALPTQCYAQCLPELQPACTPPQLLHAGLSTQLLHTDSFMHMPPIPPASRLHFRSASASEAASSTTHKLQLANLRNLRMPCPYLPSQSCTLLHCQADWSHVVRCPPALQLHFRSPPASQEQPQTLHTSCSWQTEPAAASAQAAPCRTGCA
jgi:hypothetical protein